MLEDFGNWGYQLGAVGIVGFTVAFLVVVRWHSDMLGRIIAGVLTSTSGVLIMSTLRMFGFAQFDFFFAWRALVFWLFGIGVWTGLATFLWAQFWAPRIRNRHRPEWTTPATRREYNDAQADFANRRASGDDRSHDDPGRHGGRAD